MTICKKKLTKKKDLSHAIMFQMKQLNIGWHHRLLIIRSNVFNQELQKKV
jgi:hypothetical protein